MLFNKYDALLPCTSASCKQALKHTWSVARWCTEEVGDTPPQCFTHSALQRNSREVSSLDMQVRFIRWEQTLCCIVTDWGQGSSVRADPPQAWPARQQSALGLAGVCRRISVQCQLLQFTSLGIWNSSWYILYHIFSVLLFRFPFNSDSGRKAMVK